MYLKNAVSCFWIFSFTFMNWYLHPFLLSSLFICWKFSSGIFAKASGKFVPMFSQTLVLHCCKFFCSVIDVCLQWLYNRTCTFQCFGFNLSCEWWVWFRFCNKKPGLDRKIGLDISYILYLISYILQHILCSWQDYALSFLLSENCSSSHSKMSSDIQPSLETSWYSTSGPLTSHFKILLYRYQISHMSHWRNHWSICIDCRSNDRDIPYQFHLLFLIELWPSFAISRARTLENTQIFEHKNVPDILVVFF